MESYFNKEELYRHIHDFYIITNIRITIFDANFEEILSYPSKKAELCSYLRSNSSFDSQCKRCDMIHMKDASHMKDAYIYTCHAGLTEIISPLFLGEQIVGYLFFSHILNFDSHEAAFEAITAQIHDYGFDHELVKAMVYKSPLFSNEYLHAAASLLEETASYLIYNRMTYLKYETLPTKIDRYIRENLDKDLSAKKLCYEFSLGKTTLYELTGKLYGEGLAEHIRRLRIEKAMDLIRQESNMKISTIAAQVGFDDYSYFIVVFKRQTGMTPKAFQMKVSS